MAESTSFPLLVTFAICLSMCPSPIIVFWNKRSGSFTCQLAASAICNSNWDIHRGLEDVTQSLLEKYVLLALKTRPSILYAMYIHTRYIMLYFILNSTKHFYLSAECHSVCLFCPVIVPQQYLRDPDCGMPKLACNGGPPSTGRKAGAEQR